jgi:glycerophosphoryl diester phosphodiesterase
MLEHFPRPVVFAHRGASRHAPENTLAAFELAIHLGAPAIELDVKLTGDREVVVLHDPTLDRTTDGKGPLSAHTLAAVKQLDAGSYFSSQFRSEKVPTLREVFDAVGDRVLINVELTNYDTPGDDLVDRVAGLVRGHRMENRVLFSSFHPMNLIRARRLIPEVPLALLVLEGYVSRIPPAFEGEPIPFEALHPTKADAAEALVRKNHDQNRRVHVWTVNDAGDMRRLFGMGVDGIFTDDPALALMVLQEKP